jgi:hypothetical protein
MREDPRYRYASSRPNPGSESSVTDSRMDVISSSQDCGGGGGGGGGGKKTGAEIRRTVPKRRPKVDLTPYAEFYFKPDTRMYSHTRPKG